MHGQEEASRISAAAALMMQAAPEPEAHVGARRTATWLSPPLSPLASQSRILGSQPPKEFPAIERTERRWRIRDQPSALLRRCISAGEDQERREALGGTTMWRILWVRWRRNSSLHTLHVGRVTWHPRSCLKNAPPPAYQRWFRSVGTPERARVGNTLAHLQRGVRRAGEAMKTSLGAKPAAHRYTFTWLWQFKDKTDYFFSSMIHFFPDTPATSVTSAVTKVPSQFRFVSTPNLLQMKFSEKTALCFDFRNIKGK